MDRNVKMGVAVAFVVASVLIGTNVIVAPEAAAGWLIWSVVFAVLALVFWLWIVRDDRNDQRQALESAENQLDQSESSTRAMLTSAEAAVKEADAEMQGAIGQDQATVDKDAAFEAGKFPGRADADETDTDDEPPLEERAKETQPPPAQIVEEAAEGEPLSSAQVAEAETKKPTDETDLVINPGDVPDADLSPSDEPDDLLRIEGIGPKYRDALIEQGYDTFDKIAALSYDQLLDVIQQAGMRRSASMQTWIEQARLAAKGDWEALDRLQADLDGGRRS